MKLFQVMENSFLLTRECVIAGVSMYVLGDVCKALGAGADFVMLGGMLAGHDERLVT